MKRAPLHPPAERDQFPTYCAWEVQLTRAGEYAEFTLHVPGVKAPFFGGRLKWDDLVALVKQWQ